MTASPTPSQAAAIAYFHDGTPSTVRTSQASYAVCRRQGWIEEVEKFPFHRATDEGVRAIGREPSVHLHTGFGVDGKAVCGERVTVQTQTATSVDKTTCAGCITAYNAYAASLSGELGKFATRQAPYDQEPEADRAGDARLRRQLGMDEADVAAVAEPTGQPVATFARQAGALFLGPVDDPRLKSYDCGDLREADKILAELGYERVADWSAPDAFGKVQARLRRAGQDTSPQPAEPAPTSVRVDGREVVLADASLVELACIHGDARARSQHLDPHEGRRYFRARAEADAALGEMKRRVDTLYRAAAVAGPGGGLSDVLAVIDAADRRPAGSKPEASPT